MRHTLRILSLASILSLGCDRKQPATPTVVLYTSIDEPVATPIVLEFTKRTGITVIIQPDTEASKTTGLVMTLRAEKANPRADVFWNNEVFHTINLAEEGVLTAYESPAAKDVPAQFKDAKNRWASNGLRIRMIARAPSAAQVNKVEDLLDPKLKDKICMGAPSLGTISGHISAWFVKWGDARAEKFLRDLKANGVKLVGGNSEVVKFVGTGTMLAGLTDNDDVDSMIREGGKLTGVPARSATEGTLAMPLTVGLVAGGPNPDPARKLIDYLLSPEVEKKLIEAHYAARSVRHPAGTGDAVDVMEVDYAAVAKMLPRAVDTARRILEGRE